MAKTQQSLSPTSCPEGMSLSQWQIQLRSQAAKKGGFAIADIVDKNVPGMFAVTNPKTRRNYRVVYHGLASSWNCCDCMDFRTNGLGTCKHIEAVAQWLKSKGRTPDPRMPRNSGIDVCYIGGRRLRLRPGGPNQTALTMAAMRYFDDDLFAVPGMVTELPAFIEQAKRIDPRFYISTDALNLILEERDNRRRRELAATLDDSEIGSVLKTKLYPYQVEGIRFAFGAGRALIADEMGLGKTVQAIGTAELLKAHSMATSALIVCPTSLKYQWKREIERFTDSDVTVVEGVHTHRRELYAAPTFYKIVSYHTLANDIKTLGNLHADVLIMDEVQRLKNWNTQIAQAARRVDSDYAVVLSGTPLENKLDELYSVMQFVDQYALGPYHEFVDRTTISSPTGKVTGYRNLNEVGERLKGCMLRRRKADVSLQLPSRSDQMLYVPMTKEQQAIHDECRSIVAQLAMKWQRHRFLSEKDRKRLLLTLSQMRMVCDSTYILDQRSRYDTKVAEAVQLVRDAIDNGNDKVVIFSQWERMTRIVGEELEREGIGYEYLHGGVPSAKRGAMTERFASDPTTHVFLSTDAGATGLNLQCVSVIINLDLPWNPAVLEQRIARIYRIGQRRPIQVINLISADTIEERMLSTLNFKSGLFAGVLDGGDDQITIDDAKLTKVTTALAEVLDESEEHGSGDNRPASNAEQTEQPEQTEQTEQIEQLEHSEPSEPTKPKAAPAAGNEFVDAATAFMGSLAKTLSTPGAVEALVDNVVKTDPETGRTVLQIPVDSRDTVMTIFSALGKMFAKK